VYGVGVRLGDVGRCRDFDERDRERRDGRRVHLGEYVQQVVDADQVTVLVVSHHPLGRVIDLGVLRQYQRLGEVDQPHVGVLVVVHEQQRAADHLQRTDKQIHRARTVRLG